MCEKGCSLHTGQQSGDNIKIECPYAIDSIQYTSNLSAYKNCTQQMAVFICTPSLAMPARPEV